MNKPKQPVLLSKIEASPELLSVQNLMPISFDDKDRLKKSIIKDGLREPLKGYTGKNMKVFILGGMNRLEIIKEIGKEKSIEVEIYDGLTKKEKIDLIISDNFDRRHLTIEQKRKLTEFFLKTDTDKSNSLIAKKSGVSDKTVKKIRTEMESKKEIHVMTESVGRDGKRRKSRRLVNLPPDTKNRETKEVIANSIVKFIYSKKSIIQSLPKNDKAILKKLIIDLIEKL